jgi:NlpC/P60 family
MATYRYARPYRRPRRYGHRGNGSAFPFVAIGVAVLAAGATAGAKTVHHAPPPAASAATAQDPVAAQAIAFARAQLGKPYLWGGTGPDAFDCSGLVQAAYASAGITIERTSQDQWATLPHVPASQVRPGDLVFFPGSDGTWPAPGHVAIVISATQIIQAYGTGTPIEVSSLNDAGAGGIVGFARPQAPSAVTAAQVTGPASANVALGKAMASSRGWGSGAQWACLDELWTRESGWLMVWNYQGSGAYGIPQALPASQMASAGPDYMTSPATQVRWGLGYIASRYGTPCGAWSHEEADSWY